MYFHRTYCIPTACDTNPGRLWCMGQIPWNAAAVAYGTDTLKYFFCCLFFIWCWSFLFEGSLLLVFLALLPAWVACLDSAFFLVARVLCLNQTARFRPFLITLIYVFDGWLAVDGAYFEVSETFFSWCTLFYWYLSCLRFSWCFHCIFGFPVFLPIKLFLSRPATVLPTWSERILADPLPGPEHSIDASAWKSSSQPLSVDVVSKKWIGSLADRFRFIMNHLFITIHIDSLLL